MLIGTSLGRCLRSILKEEVDLEDVALIITRTRAATIDRYISVVRSYYDNGNVGAAQWSGYDFTGFEWEDVEKLATWLWAEGKIHQPRNFRDNGLYGHEDMHYSIWMEVVPTPDSANESVMQAWENYQTLRRLAE
jgi:hypothetical protein